jgi:ATP adenylyltransferase
MKPPDGLERLWSPWRMAYIQAEFRKPAAKGAARRRRPDADCLFCRVRDTGDDRADLVLARRPRALLMLNRFPYNPAHLMVAVARHVARFSDLDGAERADLLDLTALAEQALTSEYRPDGVNYGANVGRVAGAGFPGHLHLHLVPRWNGDTNFMPTLSHTKVLPESLLQTWTRLRRALRALGPSTQGRGRRSGIPKGGSVVSNRTASRRPA